MSIKKLTTLSLTVLLSAAMVGGTVAATYADEAAPATTATASTPTKADIAAANQKLKDAQAAVDKAQALVDADQKATKAAADAKAALDKAKAALTAVPAGSENDAARVTAQKAVDEAEAKVKANPAPESTLVMIHQSNLNTAISARDNAQNTLAELEKAYRAAADKDIEDAKNPPAETKKPEVKERTEAQKEFDAANKAVKDLMYPDPKIEALKKDQVSIAAKLAKAEADWAAFVKANPGKSNSEMLENIRILKNALNMQNDDLGKAEAKHAQALKDAQARYQEALKKMLAEKNGDTSATETKKEETKKDDAKKADTKKVEAKKADAKSGTKAALANTGAELPLGAAMLTLIAGGAAVAAGRRRK